MTSILTWNILHGGGSRRIPEITLALLDLRPDIIVVTEYRRSAGGPMGGILADHGWSHQADSGPAPGRNGLFIASRSPAEVLENSEPGSPLAGSWLEVRVPDLALTVAGVYIPDRGAGSGRAAAWRHVVESARRRRHERCVIAGDFNTGRHRLDERGCRFTSTAMLGTLVSIGFCDAWRVLHPGDREYSWYSPAGSGFRIDHAFLSAPLACDLVRAEYLHDLRERRISDHAALLVELG